MNNRPLSPHLQVYRLPMLALLSITHRATGVFLSIAALLLPVILMSLALGPDAYACIHGVLKAWYGQILLFGISFSLVYHLLNGIRHLFWDAGLNLEVQAAERSGYLLLISSSLLTIIIWGVACNNYYGSIT